MSFFISSSDKIVNKYSSVYPLSRPVQGYFQLIDQHFTANPSTNWCDSSNNQLVIVDPFNIELPALYVTFADILATDSTSILAWFNTAFNQLNDNGYAILWTSSYDIVTDRYTFIFNRPLATSFYGTGEASGDPYSESSIAGIFGWHNGGSDLMENPFTDFVISGQFFGFPAYLEVLIEEVGSSIYSSSGANISQSPSFFISTSGTILNEQYINIPNTSASLDIKVYKTGHITDPNILDYQNTDFSFFFKKIS